MVDPNPGLNATIVNFSVGTREDLCATCKSDVTMQPHIIERNECTGEQSHYCVSCAERKFPWVRVRHGLARKDDREELAQELAKSEVDRMLSDRTITKDQFMRECENVVDRMVQVLES